MGFPVKLSDIIEAIEFQMDESSAYLNKKTGEVVTVTQEDFEAAENQDALDEYPEWQHESIKTAQEILDHEEDFIGLPTKYDVHEYQIMESFILSIKDREISDALYSAIKGKGVFRRFKDNIFRFNIEDEWYKYREDAIKQVAIDWCELNQIKFKDK
jgi:predicted homoserine dehydrogenase-like protein